MIDAWRGVVQIRHASLDVGCTVLGTEDVFFTRKATPPASAAATQHATPFYHVPPLHDARRGPPPHAAGICAHGGLACRLEDVRTSAFNRFNGAALNGWRKTGSSVPKPG